MFGVVFMNDRQFLSFLKREKYWGKRGKGLHKKKQGTQKLEHFSTTKEIGIPDKQRPSVFCTYLWCDNPKKIEDGLQEQSIRNKYI